MDNITNDLEPPKKETEYDSSIVFFDENGNFPKKFPKNKIIGGLVVLCLVIIISGFSFLLWNKKISLQASLQKTLSSLVQKEKDGQVQEQVVEGEVGVEKIETIEPVVVEEEIKTEETSEVAPVAPEVVSTVPQAKTNPVPAQEEKKIWCKFKAKKGSKDDRALLTWDCVNIYGWTCDIVRDGYESKKDKVNLIAIKLPIGSVEVYAETARMGSRTTPAPLGGTIRLSTTEAGRNYYQMKCHSISGKIATFNEYYANYNY